MILFAPSFVFNKLLCESVQASLPSRPQTPQEEEGPAGSSYGWSTRSRSVIRCRRLFVVIPGCDFPHSLSMRFQLRREISEGAFNVAHFATPSQTETTNDKDVHARIIKKNREGSIRALKRGPCLGTSKPTNGTVSIFLTSSDDDAKEQRLVKAIIPSRHPPSLTLLNTLCAMCKKRSNRSAKWPICKRSLTPPFNLYRALRVSLVEDPKK